jgi:NAD(P)-dependent dehydrogenase (short-subunit alcohol dehydrogenase family)
VDSFEGKVAVVTGAASGMGLAFARRFATAGAKVVLADVEKPRLDAAVAQLTAEGREAIGVVTDVMKLESIEALRDAALERFGRVNVVCNNAGVGGAAQPAGEWVDVKMWDWVMQVNLWGVVYGVKTFLPHMLEHGDGHIVNTASMAGHLPGWSPYMASKFAVVGITEGLYAQLRTLNSTVGVSCLCPGWVNTNIHDSERNRPEWAAPALDDAPPAPESEAARAAIADLLRGGKDPAAVADLVHDAILTDRFWIFTTSDWDDLLRTRHRNIENATNPKVWHLGE